MDVMATCWRLGRGDKGDLLRIRIRDPADQGMLDIEAPIVEVPTYRREDVGDCRGAPGASGVAESLRGVLTDGDECCEEVDLCVVDNKLDEVVVLRGIVVDKMRI